MKKLITMMLIVIILMSTILSNNRVWAMDDGGGGRTKSQAELDFDKFNDDGTVKMKQGGKYGDAKEKQASTKQSESSESAVGGILAFFVRIFPTVVGGLLNIAISSESNNEVTYFTIQDLVLNKIALFDVNFMEVPDNQNLALYKKVDVNTIMKQNVANWYGAIRNLAIAILLLVLIIIGILMAVNSVGQDRAKYKQMFTNWVVSFAILMLMPYIMAIAFYVNQLSIDTISGVADAMGKKINIEEIIIFGNGDEANKTNNKDFEYTEGLKDKVTRSGGWQGFSFALVWALLAYFQIKFFFMYLKRLFTIGFLVVISPLITITYSIDKANDNQAQAFKKWMSEFLVNLFIQPLHAILYIIFIYSTFEIMQRAPLLAVIFLWTLSRGEVILRRIFKMDKSMSLGRIRRPGKRK